ncbi:hypothetical protein GALL_499340 [mine drainage metagenome]|uniref:Uncharacterized protein n=1 Tax=mine drainage metagenome TaxID=410659 RepID=A0A1J5PCI7_9ZZZZ
MFTELALASGSTRVWQSAITASKGTASMLSAAWPDSIDARSRMSLTSSSRYQPPLRICARLLCWLGVGAGEPASMSWAKPRMAFKGERNSWLMLDKNSDLAWLAWSACKRAASRLRLVSCKTSSRRFLSEISLRTTRNTGASMSSPTALRCRLTHNSSAPLCSTLSSQACACPVSIICRRHW